MMMAAVYPRTKSDLIRVLQKMPIKDIEIIDGYAPANEKELIKAAKVASNGTGDLTIIMVRS
jgi:hypothetical protein